MRCKEREEVEGDNDAAGVDDAGMEALRFTVGGGDMALFCICCCGCLSRTVAGTELGVVMLVRAHAARDSAEGVFGAVWKAKVELKCFSELVKRREHSCASQWPLSSDAAGESKACPRRRRTAAEKKKQQRRDRARRKDHHRCHFHRRRLAAVEENDAAPSLPRARALAGRLFERSQRGEKRSQKQVEAAVAAARCQS